MAFDRVGKRILIIDNELGAELADIGSCIPVCSPETKCVESCDLWKNSYSSRGLHRRLGFRGLETCPMNRTPFTSPAIIGPNRILRRSPMYLGGSQSNSTRGRSNHGVMRLFRAFPSILAYQKSISILVYMKCIALMTQADFRRTVQCKAHFGNLGIVQRLLNHPVQLLHDFALLRALIRLALPLTRSNSRKSHV